MKKSAEALKNEMRQMIEGLRGKFRRLLTENDQLPLDLKLPRQVKREYLFLIEIKIIRFRNLFLMKISDKIFKPN
jgi:hypothetical protein